MFFQALLDAGMRVVSFQRRRPEFADEMPELAHAPNLGVPGVLVHRRPYVLTALMEETPLDGSAPFYRTVSCMPSYGCVLW